MPFISEEGTSDSTLVEQLRHLDGVVKDNLEFCWRRSRSGGDPEVVEKLQMVPYGQSMQSRPPSRQFGF